MADIQDDPGFKPKIVAAVMQEALDHEYAASMSFGAWRAFRVVREAVEENKLSSLAEVYVFAARMEQKYEDQYGERRVPA